MNRDNAMKARYEIVMRDLCNSVTSQNVSRNSTRREHTVSVARGLIFRVRLRCPQKWILIARGNIS